MSDSKPARPAKLYSSIDDDPVIIDPDDSARTDLPEPGDDEPIDPGMKRRLEEAVAAARERRERAELGHSDEGET